MVIFSIMQYLEKTALNKHDQYQMKIDEIVKKLTL